MKDPRLCPKCSSYNVLVKDNDRIEGKPFRRKRKCLDCGHIYHTVEFLEEEVRRMSCADCAHLDKRKKQAAGQAYRHGCTASLDGYISVWVNADEVLNHCSCEIEAAQMDIFKLMEERK